MSRIRLKLQAALCVLLLLVVAIEVNYLARQYLGTERLDLTSSARWTLASATRDSLGRMERRFEDTVRLDEEGRQDGEGQKRRLSDAERDDLRVHVDLYVSATPPPEHADRFRETESRVEDLRAHSGDFLRVVVHRLDPERSRLEIERAEQEGLTAIPNLDTKGRTERLWCGVVLRYAERKEVAKNALAPFDVEAWFVRHLESFLETEPALVCVLVEQELRKTPLARPGFEDVQSFHQELQRWIQKQYPNAVQGSQEATQEAQRLTNAHAPEVLAKDLRYLLRGAVTVRPLARIDTYNKLPADCRLLVLLKPSPTTLGAEGVEQIASFLRRGGSVLAFVPRYEPTDQQQFKMNDLGELGHYLEGLGVRVRSEVVAQQAPVVELQAQQQGQTPDTVGRRRALSVRIPFFLRLDRPDPAEASAEKAIELALLRGMRDALLEMRAASERLGSSADETQGGISELLGDFAQTLESWRQVWDAEARSAKPIEGEQGVWPQALTQQRLESFRQRLNLRREELALARESRDAAQLALRDIEAQIGSSVAGGPRAALESERTTLVADLATRERELESSQRSLDAGDAIQRAANFVRKAYGTWRTRFELSGEAVRQERTSRRAFVRELRSSLTALEQGGELSLETRDALDNWLGSFDLLYSFDGYRGGARAVVEVIATGIPERPKDEKGGERASSAALLRGPRTLVDGLANAFLLWANPIELDAEKLEVRDGAEASTSVPEGKLRATIVARTAARARYAEGPTPIGATRYLQSFGFFGMPSYEKAMMLEVMDPAKRSDELEGSMPLIVAVEGTFPKYSGAHDARALLDAARRIASPPWLGGPLAFDDDVDAPVFEVNGGWKRTAGGAPWSIDDLGTLARALEAHAQESAAEAADTQKPGRLIVMPNLHFATTGMNYVAQATQGREITSPLLQRLLEYALYGSDARFYGFDQRARDARRRLASFQGEETLASAEHRAAELWRETLLTAAASSTHFEGEAENRSQSGALGLQVQSDPIGSALDRMLSGDREGVEGDDDAESRKQRGLEGVVLDIEDRIVARAEAKETAYRILGIAAAPAVLLALLLLFTFAGWVRYR